MSAFTLESTGHLHPLLLHSTESRKKGRRLGRFERVLREEAAARGWSARHKRVVVGSEGQAAMQLPSRGGAWRLLLAGLEG